MSSALASRVIAEMVSAGVREAIVCSGKRSAALLFALKHYPEIKLFFWYEERSAAFFALGRSRATGRPVAVITTSGTAAGELLPAVMEAHYSAVPLLLVTADRPRHFRGVGAPQSAEQVGLFSHYVGFKADLAGEELCDLSGWDQSRPAHLNLCFKEVASEEVGERLEPRHHSFPKKALPSIRPLEIFLNRVKRPFVVVGGLPKREREAVLSFLLALNAPVYLEGHSGLCGEARLQHLRIRQGDGCFEAAEAAGYRIDGVLRLGSVPTLRFWRDLEEVFEGRVELLSLSSLPFPGVSWGQLVAGPLDRLLPGVVPPRVEGAEEWLEGDQLFLRNLEQLFKEEPTSEPALIWKLAKAIPTEALIYTGNSLPIREWDLVGSHTAVLSSRGLNGIDGQLSAFFGLCEEGGPNVAIIGDLTALYDLAAPWVLPQLEAEDVQIVIVNNGGGQIFSRFFLDSRLRNEHTVHFEGFAALWGLAFERWKRVPEKYRFTGRRIIELVPDSEASNRFWEGYRKLIAVKEKKF